MASTCPVNKRSCPNPDCAFYRQKGRGNIAKHSFFRLKRRKPRRYRCKTCGMTFCSSVGTPYYRLKHSRRIFDEVAAISVEGVSKSSIARIKGLSWNTVARWIERVASAARRFNHVMTRGYELKELQADEIRTFLGQKDHPTWIFSAVKVLSRLWASTVAGRAGQEAVDLHILTERTRAGCPGFSSARAFQIRFVLQTTARPVTQNFLGVSS